MAENRPRHTWHYRPGEMVVAVEMPEDAAAHRQAHAAVRETIEQHLAGRIGGVFHPQQRRAEPIVLRAPDRGPLVYLFYDLAEPTTPDFVKQVVSAVQADNLAALERVRTGGTQPVGVMPHWMGSAQQGYTDGSPASLPRPIRPPEPGRWRHTYTARDRGLDFRRRLQRVPRGEEVPVLVLDTRPDWSRARRQAARFAGVNAQLPELLDRLPSTPLPDWHVSALDRLDAEAVKLARLPDGRVRGHDVSDHALFISGLIHDLAPRSEIHVRPVLNRWGVGDLHLLLQVLESVLAQKPPQAPLTVNISLGFMPKLEHLPWIWYGIDRPNDPDFVPDVPIRGEPRDAAWIARNRDEVQRTCGLLHSGVERLAAYVLANNCLGVAAAGNDSLRRVASGRPRLGPRIPARYETVLGVAATTADPYAAAAYSNMGEELDVGDHIATFGGNVTADDGPLDGVIGVFSASRFPTSNQQPAPVLLNETGWAEWSGTSFSTAIASGLVAGYWTVERTRRPELNAADVLLEFHRLARDYALGVRTPSIAMKGEWQRADSD